MHNAPSSTLPVTGILLKLCLLVLTFVVIEIENDTHV